ncbi:hypothetical protein E2C01_100973 [Portunus trituberculatus]|uniref:Uncharacterized protein n=1 Tax=Portunus trituberculatus TaxID=210409 RepID=A0A5B7K4H8_PORTR|nr:hypothetical protein [Portunus trituberculatus]
MHLTAALSPSHTYWTQCCLSVPQSERTQGKAYPLAKEKKKSYSGAQFHHEECRSARHKHFPSQPGPPNSSQPGKDTEWLQGMRRPTTKLISALTIK